MKGNDDVDDDDDVANWIEVESITRKQCDTGGTERPRNENVTQNTLSSVRKYLQWDGRGRQVHHAVADNDTSFVYLCQIEERVALDQMCSPTTTSDKEPLLKEEPVKELNGTATKEGGGGGDHSSVLGSAIQGVILCAHADIAIGIACLLLVSGILLFQRR